ncbi:hypothetical protein TNIN_356671 [Trichonephila inaurata madagascariensis]|uniref:Uncharacterized protein n=1 Tax=Trichonephila inaurata madagascariensis TaxID=2747483 RepID=A0A8X6M9H0_9ARAC|nr:hypothetical protein TNIN_356671 [Trichonephila inaurata madagascariensis]
MVRRNAGCHWKLTLNCSRNQLFKPPNEMTLPRSRIPLREIGLLRICCQRAFATDSSSGLISSREFPNRASPTTPPIILLLTLRRFG